MGYVMGYGLSEAWMTKTLRTVLGHSSAKVTLDVYAELWPDRQKDQTRRWRRLRPRSRADATSTWRNDDDGSQETNGPHDPEGHRRTGAEGAAGRPVRADPTATHRRGDDLPPVRRVPFPTRGSHAPDAGGRPRSGGGGGGEIIGRVGVRGASKTASQWGDGTIAWRTGSGFATSGGVPVTGRGCGVR